MNKIIQTPSHLGLFEKDTNIRPANIRESMTTNVNRKELTTRFFSKNNQTMLKNEIKKHVAVKTVHDEEHVNMVISNIFMNCTNNHNITYTLEELNKKIIETGVPQIRAVLESQKKFLHDRNNISFILENPVVTSNKIDKQLPRSNFI